MSPQLHARLKEAWWLVLAISAIYLILALYSYTPADPSWSHSTQPEQIHNLGGVFGAWLSDVLMYLFGYSSWWLVLFCFISIVWSYKKIENWGLRPSTMEWIALFGFVLIMLSSASAEFILFQNKILNLPLCAGGLLGKVTANKLTYYLGYQGGALLLFALFIIGASLFTGLSWMMLVEKIGVKTEKGLEAAGGHLKAYQVKYREAKKQKAEQKAAQTELASPIQPTSQNQTETFSNEDKTAITSNTSESETSTVFKTRHQIGSNQVEQPQPSTNTSKQNPKTAQTSLFANPLVNELPGLSLLELPKDHQERVSSETIQYTSQLIEKKLAEFGVEVKVITADPGPVITRYEIEPASGVKGAQIVNLMKDLARALSLVSIRVVETIPGKTHMGLELPNPKRQIVRLAEIINSKAYQDNPSKLTLVLGKDIAGKPIVADLAKMPHVLVAGTTGSGKSVAINAMILSILYKATPEEVRLIMVDPKMLELSIYADIPHLLAPVVTDMRQAANALNWCVVEMDRRYQLMAKIGVRNIAGFNTQIKEAHRNNAPITNPFSLTPETPEPLETMPQIVVIIDELADLMMVAGKKIEELIARLAQKARAAGIHLVLATQRPSVDVITGLIKANIPTRIAFQVSSKIDSRTIIDQMGAESLLGMGDMLFMPPGTGHPNRVHGAFVADNEVHHVVEFLKTIGKPNYVEGILTGEGQSQSGDSDFGVDSQASEQDPLYDEAVSIVLKTRKASISFVQRHLRIGYNRAARLIEDMERAGLVSPMENNGNRTVLAPKQED